MAGVFFDPRLRELTGAGVLVTGGGGLVGSRIVAQLAALGAKPIVLDRFDAYPNPVRDLFQVDQHSVQVVLGDVRERATVTWLAGRADYVIHAAAYADVAACTRRPDTAFAANLHGTQTILDAVTASSVKRLVFVSSASVYGDGIPMQDGAARFAEDQPLTPISVYANTKLWGEHQVRLMLGGSGTEYSIVRYFSVYGDPQIPKPHSHSWMVPWLALSAHTGRPMRLNGGGHQVRDMVHVEDIAHATLLALVTDQAAGQTINIGTGIPTSVRRIAELIATHYPCAAFVDTPMPEGDPRGGCADTRRATDLLGWRPTIALAEGIDRYVNWLRTTPNAIPDWFTAPTAAALAA
ncbi:UDP-glucose 4-epimerase/dTDP-L-rhamnose 4-epimerase [Streptomyces sp. 1114.5]|uniref:NAD-dependent epimerase/dehydratase family protein n=1 Tax=unclassified Streptomyces TaxID=2593676 RepID=UPI000BCDBA9F|nr:MULTISPECIES: NAD-dependent epimerase/dehydratase family protein [unclassified Streptomyces]RKT10999.1 UDP-glucose 4-epimerase/dTDP-L-rhamnose 4-epimerase [Streptomyces sp. 1114.5]SOB81665.1 UDP-glucose 4-epimerase/dTDP-L-rhamnose 4-epimerase [Streptomyces sp. 1331.2]